MRPRPITPAPRPSCPRRGAVLRQVVRGSPSTRWLPARHVGGPPGLTGGFGWLPLRALAGLAQAYPGNAAALAWPPRRGLSASMRRLGCSSLWFDPDNGTVFLYRNPCPAVVSIRKPRGQDPRGGITGSPSWRSATCLAADVVPAGRRGGAGLARPAASTLDCRHRRAVGTAMAGASSVAGRAGRLHPRTLPEPSCLALAPLVAATGVALGRSGGAASPTTTPTPSGCATRRAPAGSPDAGYVSEITSGL